MSLSEYADKRLKLLEIDADDFFKFEGKKPGGLLMCLLENIELRRGLVGLADRYEQGRFGAEIWKKEIKEYVGIALVLEGVYIPNESKTIDRFGRLLTAGASMVEGFSFGNILRQEDWIPDEMIPGPRFTDPWGSTRELYEVDRDLPGHVTQVRPWKNPINID